jgi:hypothetical protein
MIKESKYIHSKLNLGSHVAIYSFRFHQWMHYDMQAIKEIKENSGDYTILFESGNMVKYDKEIVKIYEEA